MIPSCPRCGKDDFKKSRDRTAHLKRKFPCRKRKPRPRPKVVVTEPIQKTINPPVDMVNENIHDPEAGPGPATQAHREEKQRKLPPRINTKQFKTVFVDPSGRKFITNEEAEKWDQEQHDPDEARLLTLAEIEEENEKNRLKMIENLPLAERQEYEAQKEYASGEHFRSIYHEKGETKATGAYEVKEVIVEPPEGDIVFLERQSDPDRQHRLLKNMTVWEGIVPSCKNPAYAFNKKQDNSEEYADAPYMPQLMASSREAITSVLQEELRRRDQIKSALVVYATYVKYKYKGMGDISDPANYEASYHHPYHRGSMREILSEGYIDEHITLSGVEIDKKIESYLKEESGKILLRIEMILIESYTLRRAHGGSYIPTPKKLANKKCTINPDNSDIIDQATGKPTDNCLWGALGCYFAYQDGKTDHLGRRIYRAKSLQKYLEKTKLDGIPMPTPVCPRIFNKIEEMNPDISINVWEWNEKTAWPKPVIASKNFNRQHVIHLMALTDITKSEDEKYGQKNHFLWIKNKDGLVYGDTAHKEKKHLCNGCFRSWPSKNALEYHLSSCPGLGEAPQLVTLPLKDINDFEEFKNYGRMINAPCVIIADFEADNKKWDYSGGIMKPFQTYGGNMRKIMEQKANSFCYKVHWIDSGETWGPFLYRGENATQEFVRQIDQELVEINRVLAIKHERKITDENKRKFEEADKCWICKGKFAIDRDKVKCLENQSTWLTRKLEKTVKDSEECKSLKTAIIKVAKQIDQAETMDDKVWEHCHITGEFRGASHKSCNLKLQIEPWKTPIPVVFHNFRGYDSHLVCESVGRSVNAHQISVIAETFERYKSMKVGQLKYIDSQQFMNTSLANLAKNLGNDKPITSKYFKDKGFTPEQISLLCRKGVYPYEYIDSQDRFLETELPPIHEFHGILSGKITQEDYLHAQKVWKEFGCKNLGEYHDLYLKTDVLLLTDIWTAFRKTSTKYYELDPSHYVSAPSLSWDAMLKMTGVKIELFTEMAMHDFVEKAKRGGIAMAVHRYFKANNPKMGEAFDPSQPTTWISYVDANNLYGWAMSQFLPIGGYKWVASREYLKKNPAMQKKYLEIILKTKADAPRGYFLNINAHFPLKTHKYLQDLPPAVENIAVGKDMLCPYNTELVNNMDGGRFSATEKLVPHLGPRKGYVIHYQELQYYVKLGMVVDEVTEILSFDQTNWLAPYIAKNTKLRQNAKNAFEKDFFKLMNNSVYGKTMENVRKYQDVKIMAMNDERDEKKFINKVRKPTFKYGRPLGPTLVGAHMGKASVTLNKPIIVGASVLGLSKLLMYRFWYDYVKDKYGDKAKLGYMDTDSFIFQVETEDIYKDMAERPDLFTLNGDVTIGKFKDETPDNIITESIHIRAKSYHYVLADKTTKSKHKGVSKKGMGEMATDSYMPALEGSLLDNPLDKSLLTEQEAKDLAMRSEADPMTLVYRDCLFGKEVFYAKNVGIRSKDHILSLVESEKKALCPIDTKRWILSDGITSLPYRHWSIMVYKNMIKDGIPHEVAEKRAIRAKLSEKYQNECTSHIASSLQ